MLNIPDIANTDRHSTAGPLSLYSYPIHLFSIYLKEKSLLDEF
jgi:hypothetical protein